MKKYVKFIFPAVCVLIVFITFFMLFDLKNKVEERNYKIEDFSNEVANEIIKENILNETSEEKEITNNIENSEENNVLINNETTTSSSIYEEENNVGSTEKKQEAIDLVKKKWGEDPNVSFRCDSVIGNGQYIVAVVSKLTGDVQNYFKVDLDKMTVEVDY